jgi:nitroimidazol reductase NimA-like FMN-containing flavoprotein (pyridoxamine 5'-phosphate oxidase superfamily)
MSEHEEGQMEELPVEECWDLVRSCSVGRFAVNRAGASPLVVPVNYVVDPDLTIVFRSAAGAKVDVATQGVVAFQVDEFDLLHHVGWSVVVEGLARRLQGDDVVIDTWAPGDKPYVIRVTPTRVSGRRIRLEQLDTDGRGYR